MKIQIRMKQRTIKNKVSIEGIGLHTGEQCKVEIMPAEVNTGIRFRQSIDGVEVFILADAGNVTKTQRSTNIEKSGGSVRTIEHLMSALYMLEIQNVIIDMEGAEVPILDGSAKPYFELLQEAGSVEQDGDVAILKVLEDIVYYKDEETGAEYTILPNESFEVDLSLEYDNNTIGKQYANMKSVQDYTDRIMGSRTYVLFDELEKLAEQGLIKGGRLDNALVVSDNLPSEVRINAVYSNLKRDNPVDIERVKTHLSEDFGNEPARHKLLDLIGDIALIGARLQGKLIAYRTGHAANVRFAKFLKKQLRTQKKLKNKPVYNKHTKTIMDINEIAKTLPHRYPFLLVDKIVELTETGIVGVKNITMNEGIFQGHFPNNPIFPGVLQLEAMAQTGGILALSAVEDPHNYDTYFLKLDQVKFRKKILPGDVMLMKLEMTGPIRRGIIEMEGTVYVGDEIASEGILTAQIIKR